MMHGIGRVAVAAVVMVMGVASARQPAVDPVRQPRSAETRALQAAVSVDFAGGTVAQYVIALKEACKPMPVNVVLSESAAKEVLAPISLRQASLAAALRAIPAAATEESSWSIQRVEDSTDGENLASVSAPVFQVLHRGTPKRSDARGKNVILEVFSVQRIVGREADAAAAEKRVAAVLTAAETALRMDDHHATQPEMKFHKESGLLIVRGEQEDVMAVKDVIERMSDDSGKVADEAARRLSALQQMEINVRKAEVNAKAARSRLEAAKDRLAQVEKLRAAGDMSTIDAAELKAEVDHFAAAAEMAQLEVESAKVAAKSGGSVPWLSDIPLIRGPIGNQKGGGAAVEGADVAAELARLRDENAALRDQLAAVSRHLKDLEAAMAASKANNRK